MKKLITICLVLVVATSVPADIFWGVSSSGWSDSGTQGPVLFNFNTVTGKVGTVYNQYQSWNWFMGVDYASNGFIYVSYLQDGSYSTKIAKINPLNGAVLSTFDVGNYQFNSLQSRNGKLYAVENTYGGADRGYIFEFTIDALGDISGGTKGAYVGGAPDGALAYKDGTFYASDWKAGTASWIKTTTDITSVNFVSSGYTNPIGYMSGWDFEADGDLLGVSWYYGFDVYQINLSTGATTVLYNLQSQLPSHLTMYGGLTVPEPATISILALGVLSLIRRKK